MPVPPDFYPTRLVQLHKGKIHAVITGEFTEAVENEDAYCIISHVWGDVKASPEHIPGVTWRILLDENDPYKLEDIAWEVSRRRFTYMWIDTLCIDQDSEDDKRNELPKMGKYYMNALETIIWEEAQIGRFGFLNRNIYRRLSRQQPEWLHPDDSSWWNFKKEGAETRGKGILLGGGSTYEELNWIQKYWAREVGRLLNDWGNMRRHSRVWTLQEELISQRIVIGNQSPFKLGSWESVVRCMEVVTGAARWLLGKRARWKLKEHEWSRLNITPMNFGTAEYLVDLDEAIDRSNYINSLNRYMKGRMSKMVEDRWYGILALFRWGKYVEPIYWENLKEEERLERSWSLVRNTALEHGDYATLMTIVSHDDPQRSGDPKKAQTGWMVSSGERRRRHPGEDINGWIILSPWCDCGEGELECNNVKFSERVKWCKDPNPTESPSKQLEMCTGSPSWRRHSSTLYNNFEECLGEMGDVIVGAWRDVDVTPATEYIGRNKPTLFKQFREVCLDGGARYAVITSGSAIALMGFKGIVGLHETLALKPLLEDKDSECGLVVGNVKNVKTKKGLYIRLRSRN